MTERDPETWMWDRARAILEQADRMQRRVPHRSRPGSPRPCWEPPVDVFETATELWVQVSLPGVEPEEVRAEFDEGQLVVSGQRRLPRGFRQAAVHRLEIPHGYFERSVQLPPGTYELGETRIVNGCLFISLRKLD